MLVFLITISDIRVSSGSSQWDRVAALSFLRGNNYDPDISLDKTSVKMAGDIDVDTKGLQTNTDEILLAEYNLIRESND